MACVVAFRGSSRSFIVQTVRERKCIDMDVVVVQAAFPHIFDRHQSRKGLILDIGVCIMEEK